MKVMSRRTANQVASARAQHRHSSMFVRMLLRAAIQRRRRAATALLALVVAAAVTTAMLTIYVDAGAKLQREFRNYGANIIVVGKRGASLPSSAPARVDSLLGSRGVAAPFAMVVAKTSDGQPVVVAGTDFGKVRKLDTWWSVSSWPIGAGQALTGIKALAAVSPQGAGFDLTFQGRTIHLAPAGTIHTGAAEDSRIYVSLSDFVSWTGVEPQSIEVSALGSPEEVEATMRRIREAIPEAEVRPVRQLMEGEARVLGKTRSMVFFATALIIITAALCVLSTLMGWVFDRRMDFALMKALGAPDRLLKGLFAAEAAVLGAVGAIVGFAGGLGIAEWIGRANFDASMPPQLAVLPLVFAGSVLLTLLASVLPISMLRRVQPAVILRGE